MEILWRNTLEKKQPKEEVWRKRRRRRRCDAGEKSDNRMTGEQNICKMLQFRINQSKIPCANQGRSAPQFWSNARLTLVFLSLALSSPHTSSQSSAVHSLECLLNQTVLRPWQTKPLCSWHTHSLAAHILIMPVSGQDLLELKWGGATRSISWTLQKQTKNWLIHGVFFALFCFVFYKAAARI